MTKLKKVVSVAGVSLLVCFAWFASELNSNIPSSSEVAIEQFYQRQVAEDQTIDPLILAGPAVIPILEKKVMDPSMPRRRYAIGALGNLNSRSSLPTLERLSRAKAEDDYIRCDALAAMGMIDHGEGLRVLTSIKREGLQCISEIADGQGYSQWLKSYGLRRSYVEALLGWHS